MNANKHKSFFRSPHEVICVHLRSFAVAWLFLEAEAGGAAGRAGAAPLRLQAHDDCLTLSQAFQDLGSLAVAEPGANHALHRFPVLENPDPLFSAIRTAPGTWLPGSPPRT